MVDFRKLFPVVAVIAFLLGSAMTATAATSGYVFDEKTRTLSAPEVDPTPVKMTTFDVVSLGKGQLIAVPAATPTTMGTQLLIIIVVQKPRMIGPVPATTIPVTVNDYCRCGEQRQLAKPTIQYHRFRFAAIGAPTTR